MESIHHLCVCVCVCVCACCVIIFSRLGAERVRSRIGEINFPCPCFAPDNLVVVGNLPRVIQTLVVSDGFEHLHHPG